MTIAQLLESLLGKKGCMSGKLQDGTSFQPISVESVGEELRKYGFSPTGSERMINGMTGEMFESPVFCGPVYYQRLKHIVSDKIHSRVDGAVQSLTRQPLDGRSRGGGLRFGGKLMYITYFLNHF